MNDLIRKVTLFSLFSIILRLRFLSGDIDEGLWDASSGGCLIGVARGDLRYEVSAVVGTCFQEP